MIQPEGIQETYTYDSLGRKTRSVDGRGFAWTSVFNELGDLVSTTDPQGNTRERIYNANGDLVEERIHTQEPVFDMGLPTGANASGGTISHFFEYDALGKLLTEDRQESGSLRRVKRYRYDRSGNRVLVLFPEWENDPRDVKATLHDERGLALNNFRGGLSSLFRALPAHSDIPELSQINDHPGRPMEVVDFSAGGRVTRRVDGEQFVTETELDPFQRIKSTIDPLGNRINYEWDPLGQEIGRSVVQADGTVLKQTKRSFDELGRVFQKDQLLQSIGATIPVPDGPLTPGDGWVTTRTRFDVLGNATQVTDDNRRSSTRTYDDLNRLTTQLDDSGNFQLFAYDKNSNLIRVEQWDASETGLVGPFVSRTFYDELNRATAAVDPSGLTSRTVYDSRGRVVFTSDANAAGGGTLPIASLDTFNEQPNLSGPQVNSHGNTTRLFWNDQDQLLRTRRAIRVGGLGGAPVDASQAGDGFIETSSTYDRNGLLIREADDEGNAATYDYDSMGRRVKTIFADGTTERLVLDRRGLVKTRTDPNGTVITQGFNPAGHLLSRSSLPAAGVVGSTAEGYQVDGLGRVVMGSDEDSVVSRVYDTLGSVLRETQNGVVVTGIRDGLGLLTSLSYPSGRYITRAYNGVNRLKDVFDSSMAGGVASYSYVGPSRVDAIDFLANGTRETFGYDSSRRLTGTRHEVAATSMAFDDRTYGLDRVGNKTSRTDNLTGVVHGYSYDSSYRMVGSERTAASVPTQTVDYSLNGSGDRSQVQGGPDGGLYTSLASDAPVHQYTSAPSGNQAHDNNGNLLQRGADTLSYDARNRLVTHVSGVSGAETQYAYDVLGRRISKTLNAETPTPLETRFVYWDWQAIEERNAQDQEVASYVYGARVDEVLTMRRGGVDTFYHSDDLGNVMHVTDTAGAVLESYDYGDYGQLLDPVSFLPMGESSLGNPYFFQGRRLDYETLLYHFRYRQLDPLTGRFTTRDSIGIWGDSANFGNGYTFAGNNPWTYTDASGLEREAGRPEDTGPSKWDYFLAIGEVAIGFIPVVGELMDAEVLTNEDSTDFERGLAGVSLAANGATAGFLPNAGGFIRAGKRLSKAAGTAGDAAKGGGKAADAVKGAANGLDSAADAGRGAANAPVGGSPGKGTPPKPGKPEGAKGSGKPKGGKPKSRGPGGTTPPPLRERIGCFIPGTLVATSEGLRPIEEIRPGDTVLSRDEKTGEQAWRPVVRTYTWPGQRILNLTFTTGADEFAESLSATAEHPFWTHRGWLAVADLTPGTLVFTSSGEWLRVSSAIWAPERSLVHNFEVAGFHTYFVGRAELWVHNDCGRKGGPKPSPKFKPPTNPAQSPPGSVPKGWRVREMGPTKQYPDGYWKLEKPMKDGGWQPINPSTMKPGGRPDTHVPLPPQGS